MSICLARYRFCEGELSRPSESVPQRYFRLGNRPGITFYLFCPEEAPFWLGNPADAGKEIRALSQESRRHLGEDRHPAGSFPPGIARHIRRPGPALRSGPGFNQKRLCEAYWAGSCSISAGPIWTALAFSGVIIVPFMTLLQGLHEFHKRGRLRRLKQG